MKHTSLIEITPIGKVRAHRKEIIDDFWGGSLSTIELAPEIFGSDATLGLDSFSHVEVIYHFHLVSNANILTNAEHPRERTDWPLVGILAQRKKNRPNRLGVSICRIVRVKALSIEVEGLDAIDETPVIDIKPVMKEFFPRGQFKQPTWASELMKNYFKDPSNKSSEKTSNLLAQSLHIRRATEADLECILDLIMNGNPEGKPAEIHTIRLSEGHIEVFKTISKAPHHHLMVAEINGEVIGSFHIVYIPYLQAEGREDCQVEAVHVDRKWRGRGIGTVMMKWVIQEAQKRNCRRVQLTTNKMRKDAHRFYENLGFSLSHEGAKLYL